MASQELNETLNLEYYISVYGSTYLVDILYMYVLTPIAVIAFFLNILAYIIFSKIQFTNAVIFNYLRLYVFNNSLLSLLLITTFVNCTYRIFDFTNTYEATFYGTYFMSPLITILFFTASLLEICIIIERSSKFSQGLFNFLLIKNIKLTTLIIYVVSIIINIPVFFTNYPENIDIGLSNSTFRLYYWGVSEFSVSLFGSILTYSIYFIRDIVVLIIKIILNILSVHLVKRYLYKIKVDVPISQNNQNEISENQNNKPQKKYIGVTDRNLTYMAILMCIMSAFENFLFVASNIYYTISINEISTTIIFFSYFILAFKNSLNFFAFFFFNKSFNTELKNTLCLNLKTKN